MAELDLLVRAERVVTPSGELPRAVGVTQGRIAVIDSVHADLPASVVVELGADEVLLPGLVDTHVHVNDPGRADWEGFASATKAAACGGITTIVDMPLNSVPPTIDPQSLTLKRTTASDRSWVDVGFWGGAVPGNQSHLRPLHDAGVFGFKCFLAPSGVDEFPPLGRDELEVVLREIARFDGLLAVHAEDAATIDRAPAASGRRYVDFLASRPREAEEVAVAQVIDAARRTGCRVHILHVSSAGALPLVAAARGQGVRVTAETCPHYLGFTAEEVPDGATVYKCCPPIREATNRDLLWEGLGAGTIDVVVSDHSPSTPDLKALDTGDFEAAWGGVASLQLGLPAVWSVARERGHTLGDVVRWMSEGPARLVGLRSKGRIEVGCDADLCVLAPDESFVVDAARLQHRNALTPYAGRRLVGVVRGTWLRGQPIDITAEPRGRLLARGGA